MKAVIMAGGEGTRLRPLTSNQPKPMLPVANRPIMEHILRLLWRHDITDVVGTLAFLASVIRNYFGDGSDLGVNLSYTTEETPLGTAGSVRNAAEHLDERFVVISGDALTDIDLSQVVKAHDDTGALATVVLARVENPLEFGIVITRDDGRIERFMEKPGWGQVFSDTINTGIYVFEPEIFKYIDADGPSDFSDDVFPALLKDDAPLFGCVMDGYWCDVGNLESYLKVHQDVLNRLVEIEMEGFELREGLWVGEAAEISPEARIEGPALIGDFCRIEAGAEVGEYTVLGNNVIMRRDSALDRAVIHENAHLGELTQLRGCVVGKNSDIRRGATVGEGAVLGDDTFIGERAIVNPDVKIYPFKMVESGAIVSHSIVWESKGSRHVLGEGGVHGIANVDVTPEMAVRLAMAYATTIPKGSVIAASRDASKASRTLKRAMIAGFNAAGVHVDDLETTTLPVTRFHIRNGQTAGGVSVRTSRLDPSQVEIRFLDASGLDLDESKWRKIERNLSRGEFRRSLESDFGEIYYPPRATEFYTAAVNKAIDAAAIHAAHLKAVVDHGWGATALMLPRTIGRLGIDLLALNAYVDPDRCTLSPEERTDGILRVSDTVRASGSNLGVLFDPTGERAEIVDDTGRVLTGDQRVMLFLRSWLEQSEGGVVGLPVSSSIELVREVERFGGTVVWTELALARAGATAGGAGAGIAFSAEGDVMFPPFMPALDGILAFLKLCSYLSGSNMTLSERVDALPIGGVVHRTVPMPTDSKGTVMRVMTERARGLVAIMVDGVRFETGGGWILVAPDPTAPACHLWAEGRDQESGVEIVEEYVRRVEEIAH